MDFIDIIEGYAETDKVAQFYKNSILTYKELKIKSDALASFILDYFKEEKTPIVVYGHKDSLMLICFLACIKSGHPYIPVDITTPNIRVKDILSVSKAKLILNTTEMSIDLFDYSIKGKGELDKIILQYKNQVPDINCRIKAEEVYYIIYTSGSTGTPKGVQITRGNLQSFIDWGIKLIDQGDKVFLNQAPFSFDLSVMDTYLSLVSSSILYSIDKDMMANMPELFKSFKSSGITTWVSTPSFAQMCLESDYFNKDLLSNLREMIFCGETLSKICVEKLFERFPKIKIINSYGPTEATVAVTAIEIKREMLEKEENLPVGYVKEDCEIIIEEFSNEVLIVGDSVSIGYFADQTLTEKFFFKQQILEENKRGYKTGDLGHLVNGLLYYDGRIDNQIKLHGYRIEIEDIECNIRRLPFIKNAVILPIKAGEKTEYLAAAVVVNDDFNGNIALSVKNGLKNLLPPYMIPRKIKIKESLPINNNGKIDRKRILEEF